MKKLAIIFILLFTGISRTQDMLPPKLLSFSSAEFLKKRLQERGFESFVAATKIITQLGEKTMSPVECGFIIEKAYYDYGLIYGREYEKIRNLERCKADLVKALFDNEAAYQEFKAFEQRSNAAAEAAGHK